MSKRVAKEEIQRIKSRYEALVLSMENLLKQPSKKHYRADRSAFLCLPLKDPSILQRAPKKLSRYDTEKNRFCKRLLRSVHRQLCDLREEYLWSDEAELDKMRDTLEQMLRHPALSSLSEQGELREDISSLGEDYGKLYHSYEVLKYALCELEAELVLGLPEVNWAERDVLVGSFGSEEQWKHNLSKKYYYAPERLFDPTCFPIRYIALYQSLRFSEPGIYYYGEVRKICRKQRKKIWFSTRRKNGEEWYLVFRVKRWQRLARPISIQDEGVFAPKYTNLFLLGHAEKTYELFHIHSAQEYRVFRQLRRILEGSSLGDGRCYPIEGGKSIAVHDGVFELLDERGMLMRMISVLDFSQHPTLYLDDIFLCVAQSVESPKAPEVPLWLKRENEAYFERYGKP